MIRAYVWLRCLLADRRGITAIEYAVLAGGVAVVTAHPPVKSSAVWVCL